MTPERIYLSGPMRGVPYFAFPRFLAAAAILRAQGHQVYSPAEQDLAEGFSPWACPAGTDAELERAGFDLSSATRRDLAQIAGRGCTAVALLPGWQGSRGSRLEVAVALACARRLFAFSLVRQRMSRLTAACGVEIREINGWPT